MSLDTYPNNNLPKPTLLLVKTLGETTSAPTGGGLPPSQEEASAAGGGRRRPKLRLLWVSRAALVSCNPY